ncbi:MAG: hypothetical protein MUP16_00860 [Sedimentisphaerales bacterium]|nr:hypothetical protein [Sedimentisphaerales bacterium]
MDKKPRTSVELTVKTKPILEELKLAGWDYTEVINAGILAFSQLTTDQQRFFRSAAYGLESKHLINARDIFRNWIVELVADAQVYNEEMKRHPASKKKVSG